MFKQLLFLPLAAVFQGGAAPYVTTEQEPTHRKVRIEIVTTENGETKRVTKEFVANNEAEVQDALRELGVLDHFTMSDDDQNMTIDIRRFGGEDGDMSYSIAPIPPMPPMPPMPPLPPTLLSEPHAFLGVRTAALTDRIREEKKITAKEGVYVSGVVKDTPADKIGLAEGDVITAIDGRSIDGPKGLSDAISAHEPGDKVKVTYLRNGKKLTTSAELVW